METKQIVEQNISTYLSASAINRSDRPFYTDTEAFEFFDKVREYEGWGQCRKMIDCNSEEYQTAHRMLSDYLKPFEVSQRIAEAQSSSLTSYYTPTKIAVVISQFCANAYKKVNGADAFSFLDPSAGTGRFEVFMPGVKVMTTCEKDTMTREILNARMRAYKWGFDQFKDMKHVSYEAYEKIGAGTHDIIASNIPFGDFKVFDKALADKGDVYKLSCNKIHNYYFMKSLTLLSEGGVLAFITSRGFLSSPSNKPFREEMLKHGNALAIVRLPDNLFKTVQVGSDLIVFHKSTPCKSRLNDILRYGWLEDEEDMQIADEHGMILPMSVSTIKKNQYGRMVQHHKYIGIDMAADLKTTLEGCLERYEGRTKVEIAKPQKVAKPKRPKAQQPAPVRVASASGKIGTGVFSLLNGAPNAKVLNTCFSIMKRMYDNLDNDNRKVFRDAYASLISVASYNDGKQYSLHDICKQYKDSIQHDLVMFANTLEQRGDNGAWVPADIFFKDISKELKKDMLAEEALAASLNENGKVDMQFMLLTSRLTRQELIENLKGQLFFNPITGVWEEADRWLTGNVVEKVKEARKHIELFKNGERKAAEEAVNALEAARPTRIGFNDIAAQFGSRWIPEKYYEDFCYYVSGTKREDDKYECIHIEYAPGQDKYLGSAYINSPQEWKLERNYSVSDSIFWALEGATPKFSYKDKDGAAKVDEEKRQRALRIIEQIQQRWIDFVNLPQSAHIRKDIENIYNDKFNGEVRPSYNGSFQTFPDLRLDNLGISDLYQSQKDAIWMLKRNGGGVCWHEVGTGKTLIMCVTAYEMKRIGLVNKPIIIGLKANIAQIADTFRKAYPNAKVLFPTNKDFGKEGRENLFSQIKNNDWDCIIMTHEQFGQIPAARQTEMRLLREEIDALDDVISTSKRSRFQSRVLSGIQKRKENLEAKLFEMTERIRLGQDQTMDFSELGIDHIFVDESHYFKNLQFSTRNERVAGIGNPAGSQRAWTLLTAIRDIQYRTGKDLGATFASGTIVSNSLTELYIVFKYLRPQALAAQNIHSFDAWATVFCQKKTDYEVNIVGQIKTKERFASYVNLPELSQFLSQITDYRTSVMCGIDAPKMVQQFDSAAPTPNQAQMLDRLVKFVENGNWSALGIQRESPANLDKSLMLVATNVARQTALDPRILDDCRTYGDEAGCKVRRCADNIMRLYHKYDKEKGTQFVFNDISTLDPSKWNMQQELRDILVNEYGVPDSEVAFINDATSNTARLSLFEKMNKGEVRVLIGSTQKLGTGVNAQERAVAVHHLDIPWRPSDMEQRNGRAIRKGNKVKEFANNEVQVYVYATERTLDAYKFNLLKTKQMFIDQLNSGTLGIRVVDESILDDGDKAVSYAEFQALLSGNTDLLEKARLDAKIMALEKDRAAYYRQRNQAVNEMEQHEKDIKSCREYIKYAKIDLAKHTDISESTILQIKGYAKFADHKSAGEAIYKVMDSNKQADFYTFGQCGSLKLSVCCHEENNFFYIIGSTGQYYRAVCGGNATGILNHCGKENVAHFPHDTLASIEGEIKKNEARIEFLEAKIPALRDFQKKEWNGQQELADLKLKLEEIKARITPSEVQPKKEVAA